MAMATADPEANWKMNLCKAFCAPPIPKLQFERTRSTTLQMWKFQRAAMLLLALGIVRGSCVSQANLADFMHGGTDVFGALLAFLACVDCCLMNGSFLIMFMVWASVNAILFDIIFSLLVNFNNVDKLWDGQPEHRQTMFVLDAVLITANSILQVWMVRHAKNVLDQELPNWVNLATYGYGGQEGYRASMGNQGSASSRGQPLLGQPPRQVSGMRPAQPPSNGGSSSFKMFGGSGQKLGS